jgi:hypothetical protein
MGGVFPYDRQGRSWKRDAVCGVPAGAGNRMACQPNWVCLGVGYIIMRSCLFFHERRAFSPLSLAPTSAIMVTCHSPKQTQGFPKAFNSRLVTQFTVLWDSLVSGNCSVRSHHCFVICSAQVSNVGLLPGQWPDLRERWQHQPYKLYFGSKS